MRRDVLKFDEAFQKAVSPKPLRISNDPGVFGVSAFNLVLKKVD
jgi:hypothetical protein